MVDTGILEEFGASEWAVPYFIVAKKDAQVRQISEICSLNKCIKCKQYLLPDIIDIVHQILEYKYFTKLCNIIQLNLTVLDEFRSMLLGAVFFIFMNHKNIIICQSQLPLHLMPFKCGRVRSHHPLIPWQEKCHSHGSYIVMCH